LFRRGVAAAVLLLLVAAACSGGGPPPPPTVPATVPDDPSPPTAPSAPTTPTTFSAVPGRPRTTVVEPVDMFGGAARIAGRVSTPQGPVVAATVRVERLVDDQVDTRDLNAFDGSFSLGDIRGGAYRVRAWKLPDLLLLDPEVFFLAADESKTLDLQLSRVADVNVRTTLDPARPPAEGPYNVTIFLFAGTVSDQGTLNAIPRPQTPVQLEAGNGLTVVGTDRGQTDANGRVRFTVRCVAAGPVNAEVLVSTFRLNLGLPPCPSVPG